MPLRSRRTPPKMGWLRWLKRNEKPSAKGGYQKKVTAWLNDERERDSSFADVESGSTENQENNYERTMTWFEGCEGEGLYENLEEAMEVSYWADEELAESSSSEEWLARPIKDDWLPYPRPKVANAPKPDQDDAGKGMIFESIEVADPLADVFSSKIKPRSIKKVVRFASVSDHIDSVDSYLYYSDSEYSTGSEGSSYSGYSYGSSYYSSYCSSGDSSYDSSYDYSYKSSYDSSNRSSYELSGSNHSADRSTGFRGKKIVRFTNNNLSKVNFIYNRLNLSYHKKLSSIKRVVNNKMSMSMSFVDRHGKKHSVSFWDAFSYKPEDMARRTLRKPRSKKNINKKKAEELARNGSSSQIKSVEDNDEENNEDVGNKVDEDNSSEKKEGMSAEDIEERKRMLLAELEELDVLAKKKDEEEKAKAAAVSKIDTAKPEADTGSATNKKTGENNKEKKGWKHDLDNRSETDATAKGAAAEVNDFNAVAIPGTECPQLTLQHCALMLRISDFYEHRKWLAIASMFYDKTGIRLTAEEARHILSE